MVNDAEQQRLEEDRNRVALWRRWGPYVAARQWGTVREDYSAGGTAWDYFPHDHARSRAYRWGEDGLGGDQRPLAAPVLRPRALERQRPDPEGAPLRPHELRGQPRRGRQGVLVGARLHAHALVDAVALQVPAARVPVRATSSPRTPAAASSSTSTNWSTPACSTRPLLRRRDDVRQGRAGRHLHRDRRARTAVPTPHRCTCSRRCGSATPGRGDATTAIPGCSSTATT